MATNLKNLSTYDKNKIESGAGTVHGIVVSEWNHEITNALLEGAIEALRDNGVREEDIDVLYVPGSFELPLGALRLLNTEKYNSVICLGCVIQGETRHFDFICDAVSHGIMDLNLRTNTPVIFGVLTTNTLQQAKDRAGGKHGNKGVEAGITALKMIAI